MHPELPYYGAARPLCIVELGLDPILEQVPGQQRNTCPSPKPKPYLQLGKLGYAGTPLLVREEYNVGIKFLTRGYSGGAVILRQPGIGLWVFSMHDSSSSHPRFRL